MMTPMFDWDAVDPSSLVVAPSVHPQARETSGLAAVGNAKVRSRQNRDVLDLITAAGEAGMSDHEISAATGLPRNVVCVRRFDLRAFLTAGTRRAVSPSGRPMTTWRRKTAAEMEAAC